MNKSLLHSIPQFLITIGIVFMSLITSPIIANASTDVPSKISSDITWTKANSPYDLKGPTLVENNVTLIIEPGVTVNINNYYLQVNGTLQAIGSNPEQIRFVGGSVRFSEYCNPWIGQTGSGCIIQNSDLTSSELHISGSPKIYNNSVRSINVGDSSLSVISENIITASLAISGTPTIINNTNTNNDAFSVTITGGSPIISYNTFEGRILVSNGSPKFSYNAINDGIHIDSREGALELIGNNITCNGVSSAVYIQGSSATIKNNKITQSNKGIEITGQYAFSFNITENVISECSYGITATNPGPLTIEQNVINDNHNGIIVRIGTIIYPAFKNDTLIIKNNVITNSSVGIDFSHPSAIIRNNEITNNEVGILCSDPPEQDFSPLIINNNIYGNDYNIKSNVPNNINATNNWWGTTNTQTINQTLYDVKYDFNLGSINFIPLLSEANTEVPEFSSFALLLTVLVAALMIVNFKKTLLKSKIKTKS